MKFLKFIESKKLVINLEKIKLLNIHKFKSCDFRLKYSLNR